MRSRSKQLILIGALLRAGFFFCGVYQDSHLSVKYTDIDYLVFSDAAQYVYNGSSPYNRETYRYTPLLAWMLVPNAWGGVFVHYGKVLFMLCDVLTGVLISKCIAQSKATLSSKKNLVLLSLWLLNPIAITISTRGSSESVLTFIIMLCVNRFLDGRHDEAAFWLGLSIHFKVYPIVYLPAFMHNMAAQGTSFSALENIPILKWINKTNARFLVITVLSLLAWTILMYIMYGYEFVYHSYIYHLTRLDHRHNFSLYNIVLYYKSAKIDTMASTNNAVADYLRQLTGNVEKFAFLPQLFLSTVTIPLTLAQQDIAACLFVQTFAFVTFNKVMTSQYFVWFLIFLPHFLVRSKLMSMAHVARGSFMLVLWLASQVCWLSYAYRLELLGESTFNGGLFHSSVFFFLSNCWILGQFVDIF